MTTRQFDPVFSAALRNELEAWADTNEEAVRPPSAVRALLRRPQLWVSLITAVVLIAATVGVLRITAPPQPAEPPAVVDPLTSITDPTDGGYVARAVDVFLHVRAEGPGTHEFSVPSGATSVRIYLNCAPTGHSAVNIDGDGRLSGDCSRDDGTAYDVPIEPGSHEVEVTVAKGTQYTLLLMASPAPTVSTGALIDPLAAIRDRRTPDALIGDTTPALRESGTSDMPSVAFPAPEGVARLRVYLVCRTSSTSTAVRIDGHLFQGCMNSVAHWSDFSPRSGTVVAEVADPERVAWSLLVVPAPKGAKDSVSNTVLPYPDAPGTLLAEARGAGAPASGTYRNPGLNIAFTITCRGTGWLEVATGDGGTNTRGTACSTTKPNTVGFGGDVTSTKPQTWSVVPHGDISWTFQLSTDD